MILSKTLMVMISLMLTVIRSNRLYAFWFAPFYDKFETRQKVYDSCPT